MAEDQDRTRFTYSLMFQMRDSQGALRDYSETLTFDSLSEARRAHTTASNGGWVKPGWLWPHVSALHTVKGGRVLWEDLAPKADHCEHCGAWVCVCETNRRKGAA